MKTITGKISDFAQRCAERGTTLQEVAPCIIAREGDTVTVDVEHPAYPRRPDRGLGDTLARIIHATTHIKPCSGCTKRQAAFNKALPYSWAGICEAVRRLVRRIIRALAIAAQRVCA